ncbi:hypothetical protein [Nibricoccus sp. IMCC34717]|uniref:hypothetical protein n=1 Tax=Nibricoccus sp. IMCC34717 TaxID=3034021 RepID=UPI00384DA746
MKRLTLWFALAAMFAATLAPLPAAETAEPKPKDDKSPFGTVATAVTAVTGIAISPLLGTGAYGVYKYATADTEQEKASLPWFAKPSFFLPALLLVGVVAFKDSLGAVLPPGLKKPLDVLETVENKMSGLVAAGAVVPLTMNTLSSVLVGSGGTKAAAVHDTGLAMLNLGAIDGHWFLNLLTVPFGIAVFAVVWMASHAINVLILLSPWGAVDAALKGGRTALLGLLTLSAQLDPRIAAVLSLVVIVVAYFVAGWAFRLTIFGSVFCWDFFTGRKSRFTPDARANKVFSGGRLKGVPVRTYGRLVNEPENGRLRFVYKPWLVLQEKSVDVTLEKPCVARGMFFSTVRDGDGTTLLLPPRYRTHEEEVARIYRLEGGVREAGLLKAWSALRELFSGTAAHTQAT